MMKQFMREFFALVSVLCNRCNNQLVLSALCNIII